MATLSSDKRYKFNPLATKIMCSMYKLWGIKNHTSISREKTKIQGMNQRQRTSNRNAIQLGMSSLLTRLPLNLLPLLVLLHLSHLGQDHFPEDSATSNLAKTALLPSTFRVGLAV